MKHTEYDYVVTRVFVGDSIMTIQKNSDILRATFVSISGLRESK
jgi:hypothetical protein